MCLAQPWWSSLFPLLVSLSKIPPLHHLGGKFCPGRMEQLLHSKVGKLRQCLAEATCSSLLPSEGSRGSSARQQAFVMQKDFFLGGDMRQCCRRHSRVWSDVEVVEEVLLELYPAYFGLPLAQIHWLFHKIVGAEYLFIPAHQNHYYIMVPAVLSIKPIKKKGHLQPSPNL